MPLRLTRFLKDSFYHIFSRGNRKEIVFSERADYERFLLKAEEYRKRYSLDIVAYCLLPNHFHFLLRQLSEVPVSKFMAVLLNSYARYAAVKNSLPPGHVFQGRFGSKIIDADESLLQASRYIHLNPVKERILSLDFTYRGDRSLARQKGIIQSLRTYPWSSYPLYLESNKITILTINQDYILDLEKSFFRYRRFVESAAADEMILELEKF